MENFFHRNGFSGTSGHRCFAEISKVLPKHFLRILFAKEPFLQLVNPENREPYLKRFFYFWYISNTTRFYELLARLNHSQKKGNSLDTWAVFIEFLEYVNNSRVVDCCGGRSLWRSTRLAVALKEFWHF